MFCNAGFNDPGLGINWPPELDPALKFVSLWVEDEHSGDGSQAPPAVSNVRPAVERGNIAYEPSSQLLHELIV